MLKVGITGGIGSGKTVVCQIFSTLGIPIYNADSETKRLSNKAVGFMNAGDILNKAIKARYPLAPPCPTDA